MFDRERVVKKKLYKAGKSWVIGGAAVLTVGLTGTLPEIVSADTVVSSQPVTQVTTDKSKIDTDTSDQTGKQNTDLNDKVTLQETTKDSISADTKTSEKQTDDGVKKDENQTDSQTVNQIASQTTDQTATKVDDTDKTTPVSIDQTTANKEPNDNVVDNQPEVEQKQPDVTDKGYIQKDGSWFYVKTDGQNAKGLTTIDNNVQYFDNNGVQIKGQLVTTNGHTYYFDKDSGNALTDVQKLGTRTVAFNQAGEEVTSSFYQAKNNQTYYFDELGNAVVGLKNIDGHNYYFDTLGQLKKGFSGVFAGHVMYFDQTTGQEVSATTSQIKEGLTSQNTDYTEHNAVHSKDSADFENIDGYLTASSWYRPKDILRNGQNWEASTAEDFRPILSVWWPDKKTQVNYLNYMSQLGLIDNNTGFSTTNDQTLLNQAGNYLQKAIETKIGLNKSTEWLKEAIDAFIVTQSQWNQSSEDPKNDHLQNGALSFVNSPLTPDTNSNFRLLNRTPTNQTGEQKYNLDNSKGGFELLLANDVDNSNPVVQAEQLNWLYYLMNFGSITAGDDSANFDGIRVDAVDNVDADLLQIAADYFKLAYGVDKSDSDANKHLSILEDWSHNDPLYVNDFGNNQLTMDDYAHTQLIWSLTKSSDIRGTMQRFMDYYMVDRSHDSTENTAIPNYSFVRAHDSEVQTVIAQIISDLHPDVENSLAPSAEQLAEAFKVYNKDQTLAEKQYTQYNIPSAYAMLLTNKDTVPRVYYGDLYTDDGQYMATKSPCFDAINTLLKARVQYVAGGQSMSVDKNDILTSVRYGKGAMTAEDVGTAETKTQGIGVIVSNNKDLHLAANDTVVLHMGEAHKNQAFRSLLQTTLDGLAYYGDDDAPIKYTDNNGDLIFTSQNIYGVQNPQISGYLAVWVPVGAEQEQDARTDSDTTAHTDGKVFHSNAALDSQVIYEGFSNFQAFATNTDEYTNAVISQNGELFKQWGITSFQLAPQYRSSTDTSFLDSIIQNGYAFTDRYDLGYNTATKYGTVDQLRSAIKSLHANGIQAIADWVPDQIYNLPDKELATVTRTNSYGDDDTESDIDNALYVVQSRGGGQFQSQYGGAFLTELQSKYPSLFETKQISTGVAIDPSVHINEWSAKYFNGSNIQGKGDSYVLKDSGSNSYYKVTANNNGGIYLPSQLTNDLSETGFTHDDKGIIYYTLSGSRAQSTFVQDNNGNYYYFDNTGHLVTGLQQIKTHTYFFLPNGIELVQSFLQNEDGTTVYFDKKGHQVFSQYIVDQTGSAYYFDDLGIMVINGFTTIDGHKQYFDKNGMQVKDQFLKATDGKLYYLQAGNGNLAINRFASNSQGQWFYFDENGVAVKGLQIINGNQKYFYDDGHQSKGQFITVDGHLVYTDVATGNLVTGIQKINGVNYIFNNVGILLSNEYYQLPDGKWSYADAKGQVVVGFIKVDGKLKYFDKNGEQVKGDVVVDPETGLNYYFESVNGSAVNNDYYYYQDNWYYADNNYQIVKGFIALNGQLQHFDENTGVQTKNDQAIIFSGKVYRFDNNGHLV